MTISLSDYPYVILDASVLIYQLDEGLLQALSRLQEEQLRAASTIQNEIAELQESRSFLQTKEIENLERNIERLNSLEIKPYIAYHSDYPHIRDGQSHYDVWSLLNRLRKEARILVLTGDQMLTQRIAREQLEQVDVLQFSEETDGWGRLCRQADLEVIAELCQLYQDEPVKQELLVDATLDRLELYDEQGQKYDLIKYGDFISPGAEANIFQDPAFPDRLAKVYKSVDAFSTPHLQENIRDMLALHRKGQYPWVMFPTGLLFAEPKPSGRDQRQIVGYLMPAALDYFTLELVPQFSSANTMVSDFLLIDFRTTLRHILNVLRRTQALSRSGIIITDMGKNNFCIRSQEELDMRFLDACSICYKKYESHLYASDLKSPFFERGRAWDKGELIRRHLDVAHMFAASLVMLGAEIDYQLKPVPEVNFLSKDKNISNFYAKLMPPNLKGLFEDLYSHPTEERDRPFSIQILMEELETALRSLPEDGGCTYGELLDARVVENENAPDGKDVEINWEKGDQGYPESQTMLSFRYRPADTTGNLQCRRQKRPVEVLQSEPVNPVETEPSGKNAEEQSFQAQVPEYLRPLDNPPVHTCISAVDAVPALAVRTRSNPEPLPARYVPGKKRMSPAFKTLLAILAVLTVLLVLDMFQFSTVHLGFSPGRYLEDRIGLVIEGFQWILEQVKALGGKLAMLSSEKEL